MILPSNTHLGTKKWCPQAKTPQIVPFRVTFGPEILKIFFRVIVYLTEKNYSKKKLPSNTHQQKIKCYRCSLTIFFSGFPSQIDQTHTFEKNGQKISPPKKTTFFSSMATFYFFAYGIFLDPRISSNTF